MHDPTCTVKVAHSDEHCNGSELITLPFRYTALGLQAAADVLGIGMAELDPRSPTFKRVREFRLSLLDTLAQRG